MATITRRGQNYIISVNMGYDYDSKKIQPVQKTVVLPSNQTPTQRKAWLNEQADSFESEVKQRQTQNVTLLEFAENWIANTVRVSLSRNSTDLKWILPQLGAYDLKQLTPSIIADFHSKVKAETVLSFTTREHVHRTLCTMLSDAVAQGYIKLNPAFRTFPYEKKADKKQLLTVEQLQEFIRHLDGEMPKHALFYKLLLATGIKRAECVGLKWSDIDFKYGEIAVKRIAIIVPQEPVLAKSIPPRTVYLSKNICTLLQRVQKQKVDGYIFEQPSGLPMLPSTFTYRLKLICKKQCFDLTMQEIYSTHVELLKAQGSNDKQAYQNLQERLGL